MELKQDSQGFLIGERIDVSEMVDQLSDIHDELQGIHSAIEGIASSAQKVASAPAMAQPIVTLPQERASLASVAAGAPASVAAPERKDAQAVPVSVEVSVQQPESATQPRTTATSAIEGIVIPAPAAVQPPARDASGRFAPRDSRPESPRTISPKGMNAAGVGRVGGSTDESDREPGAITAMGERIVSALRETGEGAEQADPAVRAFNEVAQPLQRGFGLIFGDNENRKQDRWYRRFWREMTQKRREDQAAHRQSQRTLRNIERNSGKRDGGGGLLGLLIPLLAPLFAPLLLLTGIATGVKGLAKLFGLARMLGVLAAAINLLKALLPRSRPGLSGGRPASRPDTAQRRGTTPPPVAGREGGTGRSGRAGAPAAGGRLGSALGGLTKRLPIIGALALSLGTAVEALGVLRSDASREEKSKAVGRAGGGMAGSLGGMWAGAKMGAALGALGGPIGAAIGSVVGGAAGAFFGDQAGQIVGEKVGGWAAQLQEADIPGQIVEGWTWATSFFSSIWGEVRDGLLSKWNALTDGMKAAWESATEKLDALWEGAKDMLKSTLGALDKANDWIKDKTGMDPKGAVAQAGASIMSAGAAAAEKVSSFAGSVKSGVERAASAAADKVKQGADWAAEHTTVGRMVSRAIDYANGNRADKNWGKAKEDIVVAAEAANVDPGLLAKIARYESNFDANAMPIRRDGTKISSAHGYGQFLDGTWMDMLNRHGAKYGVQGAGKLTREQAQQYRGDTKLQAAMLAEFTKENMQQGRKYGGKDDDANVYAFHNLGGGDAKRLLTGMNAGLSVRESLMQGVSSEKERRRVEAVIAGNKDLYGDGSRSAAEAYKIMGDRMRAGDAYAQDARATALARRGETGTAVADTAQPPTVAPTAVAAPPGVVAAMAPSVASAAPVASPAPSATASIRPPAVPAPAEAPRTEMPIASSGRQGSGQAARDVPRDLPDRRIAHIVTGAYSGMS